MAYNLNINANLYKWNTAKEVSPADTVPSHDEITILKTEVKEEVYDFGMSVEGRELVKPKEEYTSLFGNYYEEDNLKVIKREELLLNENHDVGNCELGEENPQTTKYRCELCQCDFNDEIYLKSHYQYCPFAKQKLFNAPLKHNDKKYECAQCTFSTYHRSYFVQHTRIHTKDNPFVCPYKKCKCTLGQAEPCECDSCGYATVSKNLLNQHILVSHSAEPKKYKCEDCKYATNTPISLVRHMRTHTNERPFKCTYKSCKCLPGQEEFCECSVCEYAATSNHNLKMHVLLKHSTQPKKYKCINCEYATHLKSSLVIHSRIHTNEKPFKCTYKICKCIPSQKESCECNICTYATNNKTSLKQHILRMHCAKRKM